MPHLQVAAGNGLRQLGAAAPRLTIVGLRVLCVAGADQTVTHLRRMPFAAANVNHRVRGGTKQVRDETARLTD